MLPKICFSAFIWKYNREKFTLEMKWRGTSLAVFWEVWGEPIKSRILQWSQVPALTRGLESPFFHQNMLLPRRFCLFCLSLSIRHGRSGNLWRVSSLTSMRCLGISRLQTSCKVKRHLESVWGIARFLLVVLSYRRRRTLALDTNCVFGKYVFWKWLRAISFSINSCNLNPWVLDSAQKQRGVAY